MDKTTEAAYQDRVDYLTAALRVCVGALEDAKKGNMTGIDWAIEHCKPLCEMTVLR